MAHIGTPWYPGGVDYVVTQARAVSETRIFAQTAVPGDAVDPADPRDTLAPGAWVLEGEAPPIVRQVVPAEPDLPPSAFWLDLDAPLTPGQGYTLGLADGTRSAAGEPTSTATVSFDARQPQARSGPVPGAPDADVLLPVTAPQGAPLGLTPVDALRERLRLLVRARRGSFTHAKTFGRGVEPKRSYTQAQLDREAKALADEIRRDPDVLSASVSARKEADHLARFEVTVEPRAGAPFAFVERLTAGGT
jgi:hypothetical protein